MRDSPRVGHLKAKPKRTIMIIVNELSVKFQRENKPGDFENYSSQRRSPQWVASLAAFLGCSSPARASCSRGPCSAYQDRRSEFHGFDERQKLVKEEMIRNT